MDILSLFYALVLLSLSSAIPSRRSYPTVTLDEGVFVGSYDWWTGTNQFLGIPFAQPPTGNLRFSLPVAPPPYNGFYNATAQGPSCMQQIGSPLELPRNMTANVTRILDGFVSAVLPQSEDCLTINVIQPTGIPIGTKLPVVAWIFGGGFEIGSTSTYFGGPIVQKSVDMGKPIVYVSMNYRLSAYGFLAGDEVKAAGVGNLGLQDQRLALRWIKKYISEFGGDPDKVTIWGESAGAISAALHLVANNGDHEGLFRGAFMESGSPIPVGDMSNGQKYYDALVHQTGCSAFTDTLACLRTVPIEKLAAAINSSPGIFSYQSLNLAWLPRTDGTFITDYPQKLVQQGKIANVPFVNGDVDDEGTLFSLTLTNITTDQQARDYISSNYMPHASSGEISQLMALYPQNVTQGSPFDTNVFNALTPQFKRLAAMQGDLVFQGPRRFFLQQRSDKQPVWSFLSKRFKFTPIIGSCHASDLLLAYVTSDLMQYIINFVNDLNPNDDTLPNWPQYTTSSPQLLTLTDDVSNSIVITQDTYRKEAMALMIQLGLEYPL